MLNNLNMHAAQVLEAASLLGKDVPTDGAKVAIVPMGLEHPDGYQVLEIINGKINIDQFSDNECVEVQAPVALDFIVYPELNDFITSLASKVRKGGIMVLGGVDAYMLSRAINDDSISIEQINNHVYSRKSLTDVNTTKDFLLSMGFEVLSVHLNGINYEIKTRRS